MGFFDFFTGGEEGQIKRHSKRLRNLNAQAEDRELSAHWLAENGSEEAILGLLGRYTVTYEQGMKDQNEKQLVYELLVSLGPKGGGPIRKWVRKNSQFARPLNALAQVEGGDAVVDVLLDMLGREVDPFKPEKKRQILVMLAEFRDPRIVDRVPACLEDFDEGIRYAAAQTLIVQETDEVKEELGAALARRDEDSNRLRVRISQCFQDRGWALAGDQLEAVLERPPVGWLISADGRLSPEP